MLIMNAIRAVAEIIGSVLGMETVPPTRCGLARCGASFNCGRAGRQGGVYAGMLPVICRGTTVAVTEDAGQPADGRQRYHSAFDNPAMTLHILGEDLAELDTMAQTVIASLDRTAHISTTWGEINGIRIAPPSRTVRNDRPRYDVQLTINVEVIR